MKSFLLSALFVFSSLIGFAQCPTTPLTLTTQAEVDAFATTYPGCTGGTFYLTVSGSDITSLACLSGLTALRGILINNCPQLTSLAGLENLMMLDSPPDSGGVALSVINNPQLTSLTPLAGLTNNDAIDIFVTDNPLLQSFEGLENIQGVVYTYNVSNNDTIVDFNGFSGIVNVDDFLVTDNAALTSFAGLDSFVISGSMIITDNPVLTALNFPNPVNPYCGFQFTNNVLLTDINSFVPEFSNNCGASISITGNTSLSNCAIEFICDVLPQADSVVIENNGTDCNAVSEVELICNTICPAQDVFLTSQAEVDNFPIEYPNCNGFNNVLILNGTDITDLTPLSTITFLEYIVILNTGLDSLTGLENLTSVAGIDINNNDLLIDISAIASVEPLYNVVIQDNALLSQCNILNICEIVTTGVGSAQISNNALGCNTEQEVAISCQSAFNSISGIVQFDFDDNGCTASDYSAGNIQVSFSNGTDQLITTTNANGVYGGIFDWEGDVTVSLMPESFPNYFAAAPVSETVNFIGFGNQGTADFCLTTNQDVNDVKITILPLNNARPGFESNYLIYYENLGTTTMSGEISFVFDQERQEFVQSSEVPVSETTNTITFDYEDLLPLEHRTINIKMQNFEPPINETGDSLIFILEITPLTGDNSINDNIFVFEQIMVNSQDPNDKRSPQENAITSAELENYIDYIIRFQNVGTASAINVRVEDVISNKLDMSTFRPLTASHTYRLEINNDNELSFFFDDIDLPAQQDDDAGSNGYIAFQIKPKIEEIQFNDIIENTADIYFDFNAPIITNTLQIPVYFLGVDEETLNENVKLFPNPVSEILTIETNSALIYNSAKVRSILGEVIFETTTSQIDFSNLTSGVYFVEVTTNEGTITKKIIKE